MMRVVLNPEREQELRAMWPDAAISLDSMTRHFSMHGHTLRRLAERLKLGPRPNFWANGVFESVKARYASGETPQEIANSLGVTRNTINAKLDRAGVLRARTPAALDRSLRERLVKARAPKVAKAKTPNNPLGSNGRAKPALKLAGCGTVFEEAEAHEPRVVIPFRDDPPGTATIHTLAAHMCKFPIGDPREPGFTFCGRGAGDGSYCPEHKARCHVPSTPSKRATEPFQARAKARFA